MPSFKKPNIKISALSMPEFKRPTFKRPGVPQFAFWRPQMRQSPRGHKTLFISLLSLLLAVSATLIGLKATTLNFINSNQNRGFIFNAMDMSPEVLGALPKNHYHGPAKFAIVSGIISIFIAAGNILSIIRSQKSGDEVCF
jgi:hypothetical protein